MTVDTTTTERPPTAVEAALYFCCMESVQNAAKHSGAACVSVRFADRGRPVAPVRGGSRRRLRLRDVVASGAGVGLVNMRDRLDAVGGTLTVRVAAGPRDDGHRGGPPDPGSPRGWHAVTLSPPGGVTCASRWRGRFSVWPFSPPSWTRVFTAAYRPLLSEATWADHGWPLAPLAGVGCALMGAVIISPSPEAPAWLAAVRREPALGDAGGRGVQRLGPRRKRSGHRVLGLTWRPGPRPCWDGRPSPP